MKANKKAQSLNDLIPFFILFMIVLTVSIIGLRFLSANLTDNTVTIPSNIEELTLIEGFTNRCFAYTDAFEQNIPDTIDLTRFTEDQLENCLIEEEKAHFAFKLSISEGIEKPLSIRSSKWSDKIQKKEFVNDIEIIKSGKNQKSKLIVSIQNA